MDNNTDKQSESSRALLTRCFKPLLKWLKWEGNERQLFENLPHLTKIHSTSDFRWAMQNLGYDSSAVPINLRHLDVRLLPCLFLPKNGGPPKILIEEVGDGLYIYDSEQEQSYALHNTNIDGTVIVFKKQERDSVTRPNRHWFKDIFLEQKKLLYYIAFLTFLQTLLLIASPIFIISVYNQVITTNSIQMLGSFLVGVLVAVASLTVIMSVRFQLLAYVGIYIKQHMGNLIFRQLLRLPPIYTETASIGAQIARLNDFGSVRDFFSSPLFGTILELPFLVIYFLIIWWVGGILVLVPCVAIALSVVAALVSWKVSQKTVQRCSAVKAQQQDFLLESLLGMRSLQYDGLQKKWSERFRQVSSQVGLFDQRLLFINNVNDAIFDLLMILSGLATLVIGAILVLDNKVQLGTLIGTMFIIWRILTPVKSMNMMLPKLVQIKRSIKQVNDLMQVQTEEVTKRQWKNTPDHLTGEITFSRVTFRYPGTDAAALMEINFTVKPGGVLAIFGPSAAGKSTIANLILETYFPQSGRIFIDGRNIRQYDIAMLRANIAYVSQDAELFYGTVEQNLKLAEPLASSEKIMEAVKAANLLEEIEELPEGFDTCIHSHDSEKLGGSFCQKMNLARAYLRNAPILILDDPNTALDAISVTTMLDFLKAVKGKKTVILLTHEISHIHVADEVLVLYEGQEVLRGEPESVLEKMPEGLV